jgi:hypothetical protein
MDTKQLIKDSKARFNHNASKQQLKEKYQAKLTVADQGGSWTVTSGLLAQLASSSAETLVLLDNYDNPVKVNRLDLLKTLNQIYVLVMEEWYTEFKSLENNR